MRERFASSFGWQIASVLLAPILGLGFVWLAALASGVATAPHCDLVPIAWSALFGHLPTPTPPCASVPLSVDPGSLVLTATSALTVPLYAAFAVRLRRLMAELQGSGLVLPAQLSAPPLPRKAVTLAAWLKPHWGFRLGTFVAIFLLGVLLYHWTATQGQIFRDLASWQANAAGAGPKEAGLRASWWADYHRHPVLAGMWIVVGTIGTYFAVKYGYVCACLMRILRGVPSVVRFEYVPKWVNVNYGWTPVSRLTMLVYLTSLNFVVSFIAIIYLLRGPDSGGFRNGILVVVAVTGLGVNLGFLRFFWWAIRSGHRRTLDRELVNVRGNLGVGPASAGAPVDRAALLIEAGQLVESPGYPIKGRITRSVSLGMGLLGGAKLVYDIVLLFTRK